MVDMIERARLELELTTVVADRLAALVAYGARPDLFEQAQQALCDKTNAARRYRHRKHQAVYKRSE